MPHTTASALSLTHAMEVASLLKLSPRLLLLCCKLEKDVQ